MNFSRLRGIFLAVFILLLCHNCTSQDISSFIPNASDAVDTLDFLYLRYKYPLDSNLLTKYENQIQDFELQDQRNYPQQSAVVFVGSSSMVRWSYRIAGDMYPLPVIDRGFGGSVLLENIYYYPRIVKPYAPRIVVLYCENDIVNNTENVIFEKIRYFEYLLHTDFPNTILYIVSFKPSFARKDLIPRMDNLNNQLKHYADVRPNTEFIDVFHAMMPNGNLNENIFSADNLHMNDNGYDLWTSIMKPELIKSYYGSTTEFAGNSADETDPVYVYRKTILQKGEMNRIRVYDLSGRILINANTVGKKIIDAGNLHEGSYVVEALSATNNVVRKKIILTR